MNGSAPDNAFFSAALQEIATGLAPGTHINLDQVSIEIPTDAGMSEVAAAIRAQLSQQGLMGEGE